MLALPSSGSGIDGARMVACVGSALLVEVWSRATRRERAHAASVDANVSPRRGAEAGGAGAASGMLTVAVVGGGGKEERQIQPDACERVGCRPRCLEKLAGRRYKPAANWKAACTTTRASTRICEFLIAVAIINFARGF